MKRLLRPLLVAVIVTLAGCASVHKVEGEQTVGSRLVVKVPDAWNKIALPGSSEPFELWTQEGFSLDQLRFWAAIKPQQSLITMPPRPSTPGAKAPRVPTFQAGMSPDQLVTLFEAVYAADGSLVQMTRVEPAPFAGKPGVRFEFTITRKGDDLTLLGDGWAAVHGGELFAATFIAPRLSFHARLRPRAEAVIASAQIR